MNQIMFKIIKVLNKINYVLLYCNKYRNASNSINALVTKFQAKNNELIRFVK